MSDWSPEYYFKWKGPEHYEVAKFLGTKQPIALYTVRRMRCDCPAAKWRQQCDHPSMVRGWISGGRKAPDVFMEPVPSNRQVDKYGQSRRETKGRIRPTHSRRG